MKRTKIEQLLVVIAWTGLIGGILFTFLVSKGIWESHQDMAFPNAVLSCLVGVGVSIAGWAVLMQIISLSDRMHRIEDELKKKITLFT